MKCHTIRKQKTETLGELPAHEQNKSLILSPTSDMRLESSNFNFNFLVKDEVCTQEVNFKCKFWGCKLKNKYNSELIEENNVEHVVDESFIYPDSSLETDCPDCDKMFLEDHDFA